MYSKTKSNTFNKICNTSLLYLDTNAHNSVATADTIIGFKQENNAFAIYLLPVEMTLPSESLLLDTLQRICLHSTTGFQDLLTIMVT